MWKDFIFIKIHYSLVELCLIIIFSVSILFFHPVMPLHNMGITTEFTQQTDTVISVFFLPVWKSAACYVRWKLRSASELFGLSLPTLPCGLMV